MTMNLILGFGTTETEIARKIIGECREAIKSNLKQPKEAVETIRQKYRDDEERYKKLSREEAPERYTYFFFFLHRVYEGKYIVEFTMHHINRRHPMSPDGWMLLETHWVLSVSPDEGAKTYKET